MPSPPKVGIAPDCAHGRVVFATPGTHPLFAIYCLPFISSQYCRWIIRKAEQHAHDSDGWTTDRHRGYPTTDLRVQNIPVVGLWLKLNLWPAVIKLVTERYGLPPDSCRLSDAFIVKYSSAAGQQNSLDTHRDGSMISGNIALNTSFAGGGLFVDALGQTVHLGQGEIGLHCGKLMHSGQPVSQGVRYILVFFIGLDLSLCPFIDKQAVAKFTGNCSDLDDFTLIQLLWDERKWERYVYGDADGRTGKQQAARHTLRRVGIATAVAALDQEQAGGSAEVGLFAAAAAAAAVDQRGVGVGVGVLEVAPVVGSAAPTPTKEEAEAGAALAASLGGCCIVASTQSGGHGPGGGGAADDNDDDHDHDDDDDFQPQNDNDNDAGADMLYGVN
jgi:hypothetical protein